MDANTLYNRATQAIQAKRTEEARQLLMEAVVADPRHEHAWLALASVMDDMDKAIDCLKRVLVLNPNNSTAQEWLAFAEKEKARLAALAEMRVPAGDVPIHEPGDEARPVPRLGQYLLDYKFITEDQLKAALWAQRQAAAEKRPVKRLGDLLLEQGAITRERLDFAIREQQRSFYSLFKD